MGSKTRAHARPCQLRDTPLRPIVARLMPYMRNTACATRGSQLPGLNRPIFVDNGCWDETLAPNAG